MHHGEIPALSQEQAAALPWLLQHFCERGARRRRRLVNLGAIPTSHPRPAWGQLVLVRRVRLLCDGTK